MREVGFNVRLLSAGPFVTMIDRFAVAPALIPIAIEFRAPVGAVAIAATAYYLAYGLAQPFWGFASDRAGRIRIIRISLAAASAACFLSALAPNLNFLIFARIVAGASVCAVLPTALVYVGDMIPFKARHAVIADLLAAVAVGTAAGSLGGGFFAHYFSWRLIFGLTAVIALALAIAMGRLPESDAPPSTGGPIVQLRAAVRRPWARFLILFAIPEGAMVLGFLVYFAPALEATGTNPAVAGLVVATYGGAVLVGTRVIKRLAPRVPCLGASFHWRRDGSGGLPGGGSGPARGGHPRRQRADRRPVRDLPLDDAGLGDRHRARGAGDGCGPVRHQRVHGRGDRDGFRGIFRPAAPVRAPFPARGGAQRAGRDHCSADPRTLPRFGPGDPG